MQEHFYALILAGGGGTRLWPLTRQKMPKQMLALINESTMFRDSVERLFSIMPPERIFVSTGQYFVDTLQADAPEIPAENFIVEPYGKNNGPAVGLAISVIHKRDPNAVVAMLTTDHYIAKSEKFLEILEIACRVADNDRIVTLGISPTYPATGYGYIQQGQKLETVDGIKVYQAKRFTEKPDVVRATKFVTSGQYSWNSGMFIWKTRIALEEFAHQQPKIHHLLESLPPHVGTDEYTDKLNEIWDDMPSISIDFAIMEGAQNMAVIPADIGWSDIGTWSSLFDVLPQDKLGNCNKGRGVESNNRVQLETRKTLIFSDRLTVTIGVENLIIVDTEDALLVCDKDHSQDIREVVDYLKHNGYGKYL